MIGSRSVVLLPTVLVVLATMAPAYADDSVAGTYDVKFEELPTNCKNKVGYPQHGTLKIQLKGSDLVVDIERTPLMVGKQQKTNKVSARSRLGHTTVQGMDGVFSIGGRISNGLLSAIMIGEYQDAGRALCTQSWNISGSRSEKADQDKPKADKPAKPKK